MTEFDEQTADFVGNFIKMKLFDRPFQRMVDDMALGTKIDHCRLIRGRRSQMINPTRLGFQFRRVQPEGHLQRSGVLAGCIRHQ
jgi:hypothetical protein